MGVVTVLLATVPSGLVWRRDISHSTCYQFKALVLVGSELTLIMAGFAMLASIKNAWRREVVFSTMVIALVSAGFVMFVIALITAAADGHCFGEGLGWTLIAIILLGAAPVTVGFGVLCVGLLGGAIGACGYTVWHLLKSCSS